MCNLISSLCSETKLAAVDFDERTLTTFDTTLCDFHFCINLIVEDIWQHVILNTNRKICIDLQHVILNTNTKLCIDLQHETLNSVAASFD